MTVSPDLPPVPGTSMKMRGVRGLPLSSSWTTSSFAPSGKFDFANLKDSTNTYFNTDNFSNPAFGDFYQGVKYQSDFRGFGWADEQMAALKNFRITERMRAQFRAEFYNVFNRHHFANPDTNIASSTFGKVINLSGSPRQGQLGVRFEF